MHSSSVWFLHSSLSGCWSRWLKDRGHPFIKQTRELFTVHPHDTRKASITFIYSMMTLGKIILKLIEDCWLYFQFVPRHKWYSRETSKMMVNEAGFFFLFFKSICSKQHAASIYRTRFSLDAAQKTTVLVNVSEWTYYGGNGRMTTSIPPMGAVSSWNTRIICWAGSTGVLDGGIGSCGGVDVGIEPMSGDRESESVWMCVWSYILPCKSLG